MNAVHVLNKFLCFQFSDVCIDAFMLLFSQRAAVHCAVEASVGGGLFHLEPY
jgi:hypothetical protein